MSRLAVPAPLRAAAAVVNPLGWTLLLVALTAVLATAATSWRETAVLAAAALLLWLVAVPFVVGRTRVEVQVEAEPRRVVAGGSVAIGVRVANVASRRMLPTALELPVGAGVHRYHLPALRAGAVHREDFTLRTERRGVVTVGPATTRRGDPVGILSRDLTWTDVTEVMVRPPMVALESLGAGLLRDLEGVVTDAISPSDLAFHALREYSPGDDLRHVHWRSSAKADKLLVRQYLDTRRSHATVVVDADPASWATEADFETALSVAASIAVRATLDEFETTFACGDQAAGGTDGNRVLDAVCRCDADGTGLIDLTRRAVRAAPDTSLLFLLGGSATGFETFLRAASLYGPEVRRYAIEVDATRRPAVQEVADLPLLHLGHRDELAGLLRWGVSAS